MPRDTKGKFLPPQGTPGLRYSEPPRDRERSRTSVPAPTDAVSGACFNCGEAGHYAPKCPHPKKNIDLKQFGPVEYSEEDGIFQDADGSFYMLEQAESGNEES